MSVAIYREHPSIVIEFGSSRGGFTILRIPRIELMTVELFNQWARTHESLGKEVLDRMWVWLQEYEWH